MSYRLTDFSDAESEALYADVSKQLFAVKAGIDRTKKLLSQGHFPDAFLAAQAAETRWKSVADIVQRKGLKDFNVGVNQARQALKILWGMMSAQETGRANFQGVGDKVDEIAGAASSVVDQASGYADKASSIAEKGAALWNKAASLVGGGGSTAPDGTPFQIPSCIPAGAALSIQGQVMAQAWGMPSCAAGQAPVLINCVVGESPTSIRAKVTAANAGQAPRAATPGVAGQSPAIGTSAQAQRVMNAVTKAGGPQAFTPAASGGGLGSFLPWLGGGFIALKLLGSLYAKKAAVKPV